MKRIRKSILRLPIEKRAEIALRKTVKGVIEEHARLGKSIYEERIRPLVDPAERGRIVASDVETAEYELADDTLTATDRLYARHPNAKCRAPIAPRH